MAGLGEEIIKGTLSEGVRTFSQGGRMGIMDEDGRILVPPIYELPDGSLLPSSVFSESRCVFFEHRKNGPAGDSTFFYGFLNEKFEKAIPALFPYRPYSCNEQIIRFSNGRVIVDNQPEDEYVLIDRDGNRKGPGFGYFFGCTAACSHTPSISEGLVAAGNSKWKMGYIDAQTGKTAIPFRYSLAGPFSEGMAAVEVNEEYIIIIDKAGNQKIKKRFPTARSGRKKTMWGNDPYTMGNGCNSLGGFVNGKMIVNYYDNQGAGPMVYALIDRYGNVLLKKKVAKPTSINISEDKDFRDYEWKY